MPLIGDHFEKVIGDFYVLNTDISPVFRPHSPTLPDRGYVYKPNNRIIGNRPVGVGYDNADQRGANSVYGSKYNLAQAGEWNTVPDQCITFGTKLSNQKVVMVKVEIWEDMLIRSKRKKNMKDKAFRLVRVRLMDGHSGEALFKKAMWLGVWGKRRKELKAEEIYWIYRNRYDIEHFFRFGKQRLLLDKYQTPERSHLQNWLQVVAMSYWLLWPGSKQATPECHKWQQYNEGYKNRKSYRLRPTPSEVQRQMAAIILGFDQSPFLPKLQIKGKGRARGTKLEKRKRYPVLKKVNERKKELKKAITIKLHNP